MFSSIGDVATGIVFELAKFAFLIFVVFSFFAMLFKKKPKRRKPRPIDVWAIPKQTSRNKPKHSYKYTKAVDNLEAGHKIYETKTYLLTNHEKKFLNEFLKPKYSGYIINPQVRVADVIEPISNLSYGQKKSALYQITQWHFDFVITDKNYKILLVIELDDASHDKKDRARRDGILNLACKNAGLELHRYRLHQGLFKQTYG